MVRLLSIFVLAASALTAHATETVVLCKNYVDPASRIAYDESIQSLMERGYTLNQVGKTIKKSTKIFVGTGLRLGMGPEGARVIVLDTVPGTPAARTEMFGGHSYYSYVVRSINGISSIDMDVDEAVKLILGNKKARTGVTLILARHNTTHGEGREYTRYIERQSYIIPGQTECLKFELTK